MTDTKQLQLEYWTQFHGLFRAQSNLHITPNPHPSHWTEVRFERPPHIFSVMMNTQPGRRHVSVQLVLEGADRERLFQQLYHDRARIEHEVGSALIWEVPSRTKQKISLRWLGVDPTNHEAWPAQHAWLLQTVETFYRVFAPRL